MRGRVRRITNEAAANIHPQTFQDLQDDYNAWVGECAREYKGILRAEEQVKRDPALSPADRQMRLYELEEKKRMCQAQFYEQQQQWRADYWALAERRGIPGGEGGNGVFAKLFPKRGESDAAAAPEQAAQCAAEQALLPQPIPGIEPEEPRCDVAPIEQTRQTSQVVVGENGRTVRIFDHPQRIAPDLPYSQGNNTYRRNNTCALASSAVWQQLAGGKNKEQQFVGYASTHCSADGKPICDETGSVYPENIPALWRRFGMPATCDKSKNVERLAQAVESGRAVLVGVNAGRLWSADNPERASVRKHIGSGRANHAISVISCERDELTGTVVAVYINDTGRNLPRDACRRVPIEDFLRAFMVPNGVAVISDKPVW